jgi:Ca-activated chloride channel family protein
VSVARPAVLLFLVALVPLAAFFIARYRKDRSDIAAVLGSWREDEYLTRWQAAYFFRSLAVALCFVSSLLAIAGTSWGTRPVLERHSGLEIAFAIDVSRSMEATDIAPSRLDRSIELCRQVISALGGTRFSVTVFKGDAVLEIPGTEDAEAISRFLPYARPSLMSARGTDIEKGISVAVDSFLSSASSARMIMLFSDGEGLSGNPLAAARLAKSAGVRIFAVGAGTEEGADIATGDGNARHTSLKPDMLSAVAEASDGLYSRISDPRILRDLLDASRKAGFGGVSESYRYEPVDRYQLFAAAAFAFLIVALGIGAVPWIKG